METTTGNNPVPSGWKESLWLALALTTLALLLEFLLRGGVLISYGFHPHPYWLIPLVLAASRGLVPGLMGAAVAGTLYAASALVGGNLSQWTDLLDRTALQDPLLFLAVAAIIGELRDLLMQRLVALQSDHAALAQHAKSVEYERDLLRATNQELERRATRSDRDIGDLIHMAHRMRFADRVDLLVIAADLAIQHCGDAVGAYAVEEPVGLREVVRRTKTNAQILPVERLLQSPLVQTTLREGVVQNAFGHNGLDRTRDPMFVAPLYDHMRRIVALLIVHDVAPERLQPSTGRLFASIAEWVSSSINHLAVGTPVVEANWNSPSSDPELDHPHTIAPDLDLPARLLTEYERHQSGGIPLTILGLQFQSDTLGPHRTAFEHKLLQALAPALRASDGVYRFCFEGCYVLVLPGTGLAGAGIVEARLRRALAGLGSALGVGANLWVFGPSHGETSPNAVLSGLAHTFRDHSLAPLGLAELPPATTLRVCDDQDLEQWLARERSIEVRFGFQYHTFEVPLTEPNQHFPQNLLGRLEEAIEVVGLRRPKVFWTKGQPMILAFVGTAVGKGTTLEQVQRCMELVLGPTAGPIVRLDPELLDMRLGL